MINDESTETRARTRPYTYPETLRAVAHALERPGQHLVEPEVSRLRPDAPTAQTPAAELLLDDGHLAGITGWALVMKETPTVVLTRTTGPQTCVRVTGALPTGPIVPVLSWIDEMPIEVGMFGVVDITLDELVALTAANAPVATSPAAHEALVGAR